MTVLCWPFHNTNTATNQEPKVEDAVRSDYPCQPVSLVAEDRRAPNVAVYLARL